MKLLQLIPVLTALASIQGNPVPELDGKIIGGTEVDIRDYPYQVSVRILHQHLCGGSILDASTVLTKAGCVEGFDPALFGVRVGNTHRDRGQYIKVSQITQHPKYHFIPMEFPTDYDMAILKLAIPLNFTDSIQPIELQPKGVEVPAGTVAWVSGFGIGEKESMNITYLRAVDVAVITNAECANKSKRGQITARMMCAQTLEHGFHPGDMGGPLVANGKLIGVASWFFEGHNYPGYFAKVSNMYDWIIANK